MSNPTTVQEHYEKEGLIQRVQAAIDQAGLAGEGRIWKDFSPLDQFHVRGLEATSEQAAYLDLNGARLLDVGCGLGGPARHLASEFNVHITGLDLSESFIEVARLLTSLSGLSDKVQFQVGNALDLPFEDKSFDIVWTQHVAMNIADRHRLYREMGRVLKPGGKLAIYDVMLGNGQPLTFPLPWATVPEISHVISGEEQKEILRAEGFTEQVWVDKTDEAVAWLESQRPNPQQVRPLGLHVVMGPEFGPMVRNLAENVKAGRLRFVQTVWGI